MSRADINHPHLNHESRNRSLILSSLDLSRIPRARECAPGASRRQSRSVNCGLNRRHHPLDAFWRLSQGARTCGIPPRRGDLWHSTPSRGGLLLFDSGQAECAKRLNKLNGKSSSESSSESSTKPSSESSESSESSASSDSSS